MRAALKEASKAWGHTHPNPAVGAVVVHRGAVVASGHTAPVGGPHAEVQAIAAWREAGAPLDETTTLVVTLEPCSTHGRTPPCTEAIVKSGIRRVVMGAMDPNPAHAGRAVPLLEAAGVEVETGVIARECADLNLIFNHWIARGHPFVAAKMATTLDGRVAAAGGRSQWITGAAAREDVARWRSYFPAIAAGAGTLWADNPRLTVRLPDAAERCARRFIFDGGFSLRSGSPKDWHVFADAFAGQTTLVVDRAQAEAARAWLKGTPVAVWALEAEGAGPAGRVRSFMDQFQADGLTGLYLEGGPGLWSAFLAAGKIDYLFAYRAPVLMADAAAPGPFFGQSPDSPGEALRLSETRVRSFRGGDQLVRGFLVGPRES